MRYISIPNLETPISVIGLGAGTPKAFTPETYDRGAALLAAYLEAGGNLLDTAHIYGLGASETMLGQWFQNSGARKSIVLITKGCHPPFDPQDPFAKQPPRVTPGAIHADLNESLERLKTDSVDLYLLHRDDESVPVGPIVEALNQEKRDGRVTAFGGSNWSTARIAEANDYAAAHHLQGFSISSPSLSLPRPKHFQFPGTLFAGEAERTWHMEHQFPLLAWSAQAAGFLNSKPTDPPDSFVARTYFAPDNFERVRRARELAAHKHATTMQIAVAFVLNQSFPVSALVGPSTPAHLGESLGALDVELTRAELEYLDLATEQV